MDNKCVCGHSQEEHLMITSKACTLCECEQYRLTTAFQIRTILSDTGISRVSVEYGSTKLQLTGDAAVQIGLELISAGYAARGEMALYKYAEEHNLDIKELLTLERE